MKDALDTLLAAARPFVAANPRVLFLNARPHPALVAMGRGKAALRQNFKPYAVALENAGLAVEENPQGLFDCALVLAPKNALEARHDLARALDALKEGGVIVCAAANDAGGKRLEKILKEFGCVRTGALSQNHAKAAWGTKTKEGYGAIAAALEAGKMREVFDGFQSMPGLFSWDRPDKGSEILLRFLPGDLRGRGADFGCGYGFLARHALRNNGNISHLYCVDADARGVQACKINLKEFADKTSFLWEDLTRPVLSLEHLDFIVMNPPFHEGKKTDSEIGAAFIQTAAASLKTGGVLWMVANANLPYEGILKENFSTFEMTARESGFKIFRAAR